jgi:TolB-like protein
LKLINQIILLFLAVVAYGQQERVAIISTVDDRDSIGFSDLAYLTDRLRETAVNVLPKSHYGVMTTESIVAFLGSQERAAKECKEASCLAELGRKVNADYVAQGRIGRFSDNLTIKVELYSSKSGNLISSFTGNSKDIFNLLYIVDEKAPDLFKKMPGTSDGSTTVSPPAANNTSKAEKKKTAADELANMEPREKVQKLIKAGIRKNKEKIQKESSYLSSADRDALYEKNKKKGAGGWAALDFFVGFGLGSYIQGNIGFGVTQSVLDVLGYYILLVASEMDTKEDDYCSGYYCEYEKSDDYIMPLMVSCAILGTSRIMSLIFPFVHQKKYNRALKDTLQNSNNVSYSIDPLIVPKNGVPAVGLALNLRY